MTRLEQFRVSNWVHMTSKIVDSNGFNHRLSIIDPRQSKDVPIGEENATDIHAEIERSSISGKDLLYLFLCSRLYAGSKFKLLNHSNFISVRADHYRLSDEASITFSECIFLSSLLSVHWPFATSLLYKCRTIICWEHIITLIKIKKNIQNDQENMSMKKT